VAYRRLSHDATLTYEKEKHNVYQDSGRHRIALSAEYIVNPSICRFFGQVAGSDIRPISCRAPGASAGH
jgi:hypothetical protein